MIKQSKLELIYGPDITQKLLKAKVLVVGAGGIGCELMKCLSLTGFTNIIIIDLDTIDVSNLNRQFLFRREHVDKSKSLVVKEQIVKQNPQIQIESYVGKIQEDRFGFHFFSQFDIVINALDNEEARKHVNMMCFNLSVPLVDAGTNGYNATCISIFKGKTACYQCMERKTDQNFPVCTIRQKPEKIIHCIVWAKALFEGLYGPKEESNNILDDIIQELQDASSHSNPIHFAHILFDRVFNKEPGQLLSNMLLILSNDKVDLSEKKSTEEFISKIKSIDISNYKAYVELEMKNPYFKLNQHKFDQENSLNILKLQEYIYMFIKSILTLHEERKDQLGNLEFDKDDDLIVDFVTAASNIRAFNFSIQMESKFKIKEMAGRIIPAISSSNALIASIQVFEAIKILSKKFNELQGVQYNRVDKQRISSYKRINDPPIENDDSKHLYCVEVRDLSSLSLGIFIQEVLYTGIKLEENLIIEFNSNIIYELDEDMDEEETAYNKKKLNKSLNQFNIKDSSILQVSGTLKGAEDNENFYIQIVQDLNLSEDFKLTLLKKGLPNERKQEEKKKEKEISFIEEVVELGSDQDEEEEEIEIDEEETNRERSGILGKRVFSEIVEDDIITNETLKRSKK